MNKTYYINGSFQTAFRNFEFRNEEIKAYSERQARFYLFENLMSKLKTMRLDSRSKSILYNKVKTLKVTENNLKY